MIAVEISENLIIFNMIKDDTLRRIKKKYIKSMRVFNRIYNNWYLSFMFIISYHDENFRFDFYWSTKFFKWQRVKNNKQVRKLYFKRRYNWKTEECFKWIKIRRHHKKMKIS